MTLALAARRQIGYALGRAAGGLSWLLRDDFTTDLPAGSVNGTAAEPGPGTRTVYDTNNKISLSGGKLSFATGGLVGDGLIYSAMTRTAGRMLLVSGQHSGGTGIAFGWGALALPNAITERIGINQPGINTTTAAYVGLVVSPTLSASTAYYVAYIQGATNSMFILLTGGDYAAWTLLWKHTSAATGTTPVAQMRATNVVGTADFIRVPDALWLPTPLASDGFGSTFGTTDGLGHAEGIAGGIGAGGSGVAWSNVGSTWSVSGGKAINTPVPSSELLINGSMELDSNWASYGTPVTNERSTGQVHGGTYSRKLVADSNFDAIGQSVALSVGTWYRVQAWTYLESGTGIVIQDYNFGVWLAGNITSGSWVLLSLTFRATVGSSLFTLRSFQSSPITAYIDDASFGPLALSSLVSLLETACSNVFCSVALTRTSTLMQAGLAVNFDSTSSPTNGVLVYIYVTNIYIAKIVAGTWTQVSSTAYTYSAGARLVVAKNGTEYRVYYNDAFVVAVTISDAGIVNNTLHGMFSTDASNTLDDFTCYATGTGGEYATLDQYIQP